MKNTPTPTPTTLRAQRNPEVRTAAVAVIRALHDCVAEADVDSVCAWAQLENPGVPMVMAMQTMAHQVESLRDGITAYKATARSVAEGERIKNAPMLRSAVQRMYATIERTAAIGRELATFEKDRLAQVEKLQKAGLSDVQIEALVPAVNTADLLTEREALETEREALEQFIRTGDVSHLPDGFVVVPAVKDVATPKEAA